MKVTNDRIHSQLSGLVNGGARSYLQDAVDHYAKRQILRAC